MKRFSIIAAAAAILALASCQKFELEENMPTPEEPAQAVYNLDLCFDATVDEATVNFYDADGYLVSAKTVSVPTSSNEVVSVSFASETNPEYLYTEGLQNGEDGGLLRIPQASVQTKSSNPILLIIR